MVRYIRDGMHGDNTHSVDFFFIFFLLSEEVFNAVLERVSPVLVLVVRSLFDNAVIFDTLGFSFSCSLRKILVWLRLLDKRCALDVRNIVTTSVCNVGKHLLKTFFGLLSAVQVAFKILVVAVLIFIIQIVIVFGLVFFVEFSVPYLLNFFNLFFAEFKPVGHFIPLFNRNDIVLLFG